MSEVAIRVEGLSKLYHIGRREPYYTLRDTLTRCVTAPFRRFSNGGDPALESSSRLSTGSQSAIRNPQSQYIWALKDVSFEVKQGEVVGVIGRNGAGKSTLLKILSRITEPTEGQAEVNGRVGSLLEVGTGFHPELTGRENIYLNGAILGMKKSEIERSFDEIVAFAEIEKFLDTPVKYYSSGMYMRLAFSVAAHLESEILLVDEVLAVGDVAFQKKCLGKMGDVAKQGRTVLLVSHHLAAVQRLCSRSLLLSQGILIAEGATPAVTTRYLSLIQDESNCPIRSRQDRGGDGSLRFVDFYVETETRGVTSTLYSGEPTNLVATYESVRSQGLTNVSVSIPFFNSMGQHMFMCWTRMTGQDFGRVARNGEFRAHINKMPLTPGRYTVNLWCEVNGVLCDWVREAAVIHVADGDFFGSGFLPPRSHGGLMVDHFWKHEVGSSKAHQ